MTKAEQAVEHMINRIRKDGRLAYLIGPLSEGYTLLTDAYAEMRGLDGDEFRRAFAPTLTPERVVRESDIPGE